MRGKAAYAGEACLEARITPAYAGKSLHSIKYPCQTRDHPRLCGEKEHICIHAQSELGSPPPMRGKVERR